MLQERSLSYLGVWHYERVILQCIIFMFVKESGFIWETPKLMFINMEILHSDYKVLLIFKIVFFAVWYDVRTAGQLCCKVYSFLVNFSSKTFSSVGFHQSGATTFLFEFIILIIRYMKYTQISHNYLYEVYDGQLTTWYAVRVLMNRQ